MEFFQGIPLFKLVVERKVTSENFAKHIFRQICSGIEHLHHLGIAHQDIKLENIMVDKELSVKIIDLGSSTRIHPEFVDSVTGSGVYKAPEVMSSSFHDGFLSDIFAAGVVLFCLVNGFFPFTKASKEDRFWALLQSGKHDEYWKALGNHRLSKSFKELVLSMLSPDPKKRPNFKEVLNHKWFI